MAKSVSDYYFTTLISSFSFQRLGLWNPYEWLCWEEWAEIPLGWQEKSSKTHLSWDARSSSCWRTGVCITCLVDQSKVKKKKLELSKYYLYSRVLVLYKVICLSLKWRKMSLSITISKWSKKKTNKMSAHIFNSLSS